MDYQKIILVGNATKDAEWKTSNSGEVTFTTFAVGVGDRQERPTFFPVTVFGKQAVAVAEYVGKGRQVLVEGRVEVNDNGYFNVVADRVVFGVSAGKAENRGDN